MKLSIITINYNNKAGLEKTVASVMAQTWRDFEWIIIDGGSTDGSAEVIAELAKKLEANISYWCSEPDGGIYQALNKGVKFAHGEYVNFMNAGDAFVDEYVLAKVFKEEQVADILYGNAIFLDGGKTWEATYPKEISMYWVCHEALNHQSTFTKRKVFDKVTFDTKYKIVADRKFWMQCMLIGYSFKHIETNIALYDHRGFSVKNSSLWEQEQKQIYDEIIADGINIDLIRSKRLEYYESLKALPIAIEIMRMGGKVQTLYVALSKIYLNIMQLFRL